MTKKKIIIIGAIIALIIAVYSFYGEENNENVSLTIKVERGDFISEVITSGEAQSSSLKKINGPSNLRKFRLREIKIQDLIPEGTIVKKGDYVGKLDPSEVNEKIIGERLNLETAQSRYTQQQLDTTLTLKQERKGIRDLSFNIEEMQLELKQSTYEPPATIRKLEIKIEKAERSLEEKKENYHIKKRQANAKMIEVGTKVSKIIKRIDDLINLQESFTIYSDSNGMITYAKDWDGGKKKVGSSINPWNLSIASLPNLTKMESKTYTNEVDIRKVKKGLPVKVGFDAFPEIELEGIVTDVANVGERKRGSDIKVFQIMVKLESTNNNIKPGMTTSNRILTDKEENVLMIPLEAVFSKDTISYVYLKSGFSIKKKQVELGKSNNDLIIVKKGLKENNVLFLNKPKGYNDKSIKLLN